MQDLLFSQIIRNVAAVLTAASLLGGCLSDDKVENNKVALGEMRVSGSVGDGPVVGAAMVVHDQSGAQLASFESDALASFNISLSIDTAEFPLVIDATGGIDLVTNLVPDFDMTGAILRPDSQSVSNVNPFSTIAVALARELPGGLTVNNLVAAEAIVSDRLNSGLTTLMASGPMQTHIDEDNIAEIVKASETLAEIVRRTRDLLNGAGYSVSADDVVAALSADLTDEVIDGRGGSAVDPRTAAISTLVSAQVLMESMANELFVNGIAAAAVMNAAIEQVSVRTPTVAMEDLQVTANMAQKASVGLEAATAVDSAPAIASLYATVDGIQAGMDASLVRSLLPSNYRGVLQGTLTSAASADISVIDTINAIARGEGGGTPVNRSPTISGTPNSMVEAGSAYVFAPTASDPDGDSLTFSVANLPTWASVNSATGQITGTPTVGDVGTTSGIVITVSDGDLSANLGPFSITVFQGNAAPTISGNPLTTVAAGQGYVFAPSASDPNGDALSFTISGQPSWTIFNSSSGRLTGAPDAGDVGTYANIVITVSDGQLSDSVGPFSITVTPNNTAPVISGTPPQAATVGQAYSFTPSATDADGDNLTFSVSNRPAWANFNTSTGRINGTPGAGDVGTYNNVSITVSDGMASDTLGPFTITVSAPNTAPTISGTPPQSVTAGQAYSFTPSATDADGDNLTFSVSNLPGWATFNTSSGRISGTPVAADVGTYSNVSITVTDGAASDTLGPFTITVNAISLGSVTLSWTPPTQNEDGSTLTDLAGYRIYWGTTSGVYTDSLTIDNPGISTYVVDNIAPGTYEFVATSYNASGVESTYSNPATKVVP